MTKLQSNEDLILDLMNFSPFGALGQVFVMEAVRAYAELVATKPVSGGGGLVNPAVWQQIAQDVKGRMDAFYNRHDVGHIDDSEEEAAHWHAEH